MGLYNCIYIGGYSNRLTNRQISRLSVLCYCVTAFIIPALITKIYISIPIVILGLLIAIFNDKIFEKKLKTLEEQGITSSLPKYKEKQAREWARMSEEQRKQWLEEYEKRNQGPYLFL